MTTGRPREAKKAGYAALVEMLDLDVITNWHESTVAATGTHRVVRKGDIIQEVYPQGYWPGETVGDHLEFALKYDGVNLSILARVFRVAGVEPISAYVRSKPTGKYARRIWYLYEFLVGERIPVDDLKSSNYVDLLEGSEYYTSNRPRKVSRQRINENLLGDRDFCPIVRRTDGLRRLETAALDQRCRQIVSSYSAQLLKRALAYLYTKETKSSFEIERITPGTSRTERFVALLKSAEREESLEKSRLIELQNQIVDPRFAESDYRTTQNYVGETVAWRQERVHYACPKPDDVPALMAGLLAAHRCMRDTAVHPVVHAAVTAYGFVFIHPFEDGNGRIHRLLIHSILARRGFTPDGVIFPVSAAMMRNRTAYDASLEAFSRPLMSLVEFTLDDEGRMTVHNETRDRYRYIDMTAQVEALFSFVEATIDTELVDELRFLATYDRTKAEIQSIVDMPDRQIDLFIRLCVQNNGRLSEQKHRSHFASLTDDEVARLENVIRAAHGESADAR